MTFFLDRCLGRSEVANGLTGAGVVVKLHDDHFGQNVPDTAWLAAVGADGWVVLTKDKRISRRELERRALEEARVAAFVLIGKDMSGQEMAQAFVAALPRMQRVLQQYRRPLIATVTKSGAVRIRAGKRRGGPK